MIVRALAAVLMLGTASAAASAQVAPPITTEDSRIAASGTTADGREVRLQIAGDVAWLQWRTGDTAPWSIRALEDDPRLVLAVLADRRVDFVWPALIAWAGDDLGRLRSGMVARAEGALAATAPDDARNALESTVRPHTRALLQFASVLFNAGYADRSLAMMRDDLAKRRLKSGWDRTEWVMVNLRIAQQLVNLGRSAEAIDLLAAAAKQPGIPTSLVLNFDVNRAAYLANAGRYDEALALIDDAERAFGDDKIARRGSLDRIDGSARQFAWIRGCALQGLGRSAEAAQWLDFVRAARDPNDPVFVTERSATLRYRVQLCTRDSAQLLDDVVHAARVAPFAPDALLLAQPGARWANDPGGTLARVGGSERLRAVVRPWMRVLPPSLVPALNGWR